VTTHLQGGSEANFTEALAAAKESDYVVLAFGTLELINSMHARD